MSCFASWVCINSYFDAVSELYFVHFAIRICGLCDSMLVCSMCTCWFFEENLLLVLKKKQLEYVDSVWLIVGLPLMCVIVALLRFFNWVVKSMKLNGFHCIVSCPYCGTLHRHVCILVHVWHRRTGLFPCFLDISTCIYVIMNVSIIVLMRASSRHG